MEKRWFIKYIGNHWVGCSHTTPICNYACAAARACNQYIWILYIYAMQCGRAQCGRARARALVIDLTCTK